ncbi:MAG TPA: acyl carrier protein [Candidatus Hodarchaeales archaeon]|nr:acyl carrier protein [Candidatus Hodarchaeales archaeon]
MVSALEDILERLFQVPKNQISNELGQENLESWDSMTHLLLITELEETYKIRLTDNEILKMKTVATIKQILTKYGVKL